MRHYFGHSKVSLVFLPIWSVGTVINSANLKHCCSVCEPSFCCLPPIWKMHQFVTGLQTNLLVHLFCAILHRFIKDKVPQSTLNGSKSTINNGVGTLTSWLKFLIEWSLASECSIRRLNFIRRKSAAQRNKTFFYLFNINYFFISTHHVYFQSSKAFLPLRM